MAKSTIGSLLINLELQTATLNKQVSGINKKFDSMGNNLKKVFAGLAVGSVFKNLITDGLKYNSQLETTTNSITALLVATSKLEDENGNIITQQELYNNAMSESVGIMSKLQEINAETPMGLDETAQIYKTMLPSMRAVGATQEELIELTKNLAVASGTAGLKTQQLLSGVDGLATGTVLANSELGRFLTALGLSNNEIKESADVVGLLNEKLGKLKGEITMDMQLSTLGENWGAVLGGITKSLWTASKGWIGRLSDFLAEFKKGIPDMAVYFKAGFETIKQYWRLGLAQLIVWYEEFMDTIRQTFEYLTSLGVIELSVNLDLVDAKQELKDAQAGVQSFTRNMLNLFEAQEDLEPVGRTLGLALDNATESAGKLKNKLKEVKPEITDIERLADGMNNSLERGMTGMFSAWMDGALNFKDLLGNILKDISAQIFQMTVAKQASSFLLSSFGFAQGGAFTGGVQKFATGGVVNSPTVFPMASGIGLMGEAGAEAIMPLTRTSSGNLGVEATQSPVVVNVNNYGDDNVEVSQTDNSIDIVISKISNDIARGTGSIGSSLEQRYGLRKV